MHWPRGAPYMAAFEKASLSDAFSFINDFSYVASRMSSSLGTDDARSPCGLHIQQVLARVVEEVISGDERTIVPCLRWGVTRWPVQRCHDNT